MNRAGHFRITRRLGRHHHIGLKIVQFISTTLGDLILENRFPCWCCSPNWQMVYPKPNSNTWSIPLIIVLWVRLKLILSSNSKDSIPLDTLKFTDSSMHHLQEYCLKIKSLIRKEQQAATSWQGIHLIQATATGTQYIVSVLRA